MDPSTINHDQAMDPSTSNHDQAMDPSTINYDQAMDPTTINHDLAMGPSTIYHDQAMDPSTINHDQAMDPSTINYDQATDPSTINYDQAMDPSTINHDQAMDPSTINYDQAMDPSTINYDQAMDPSAINYDQTMDPSIVNYDQAIGPSTINYDQAMDPSAMNYEQAMDSSAMDYEQAIEWCIQHGVDLEEAESLEEIQALIRANIKIINQPGSHDQQLTGSQTQGNTADEVSTRSASRSPSVSMETILTRDARMKEDLVKIYDQLLQLTDSVQNRAIRKQVDKLAFHRKQLADDIAPIVIAGETSAGKSTLLNLLLGSDVLPNRLLAATSTICRIHNSPHKRLEVDVGQEGAKILSLQSDDDDDSALKTEIERVCAQPREETAHQTVDIYWPLPMLQGNTVMVDTPGIGESEEMTRKLLEYLPNATAFIYVIDISQSGGVEKDKLLRLFEEQKKIDQEGGLPTDFSTVLFVCNKWDIVQHDQAEAEKLWQDTNRKLKVALPEVTDDKIFKMSALNERKHRKLGFSGYTEPFKDFLVGLEKMISSCVYNKISSHYRWIDVLLRDMQKITAAHLRYARISQRERDASQRAMQDQLKALKHVAKMIKERLLKQIKRDCKDVTKRLFDHMHSASTKEMLLSWETSDLPDGNLDSDAMKSLVQGRVEKVITRWETGNNALQDMSTRLIDTFQEEIKRLGHQLKHMDTLIEGVDIEEKIHSILGDSSKQSMARFLFSRSEKLVLAISSPLWLPLAAAASVVLFPVSVGMLIKRALGSIDQTHEKDTDKKRTQLVEQMNWMINTYLNQTNIAAFVKSSYYSVMKKKVIQLCEDFVENRVDAEEDLLAGLGLDQRSPKEIIRQYSGIHKQLHSIIGKVHLFRLKYNRQDQIPANALEVKERLGSGNYSDVYKADWRTDSGIEQVALKCLHDIRHEGDLYNQLTEIECLRNLHHPNLVEFLGIALSSHPGSAPCTTVTDDHAENQLDSGVLCDSQDTGRGTLFGDTWQSLQGCRLMIVMELCEQNLTEVIFRDRKLQCRRFENLRQGSGNECFWFFAKMATGICDGLSYMHSMNIAHRDLKLSNILVRDNVAKISDLGFARHELNITGTFVGTISHMSPEILRHDNYTTTTDMYSLAILLWEMWYGRTVYSEDRFVHLSVLSIINMVIQGDRPSLHFRESMPGDLKSLVRQCWDNEPSARPTAMSVGQDLRRLYRDICGADI